jgi:hypothetical protein
VSFKCTLRNYKTQEEELYSSGDYVTVECEKGYDIGLISRELFPGIDITEEGMLNLYPILGKVNEEKGTMEELLKSKIIAENESLGLCRNYCHGRKVGTFLEVISTEFQYDHKKLTLYVTKSGEVSVCKLVRKLFDSFHTRICVEEIQTIDELVMATQRYLELSRLPLPLYDVFFEPNRMPPQSEAIKNQKNQRKNQRSQNGYTQSGANSTLLSALHHYRPTFTSGMNTAPPNTMGYAAQLPARSIHPSAMYSAAASSQHSSSLLPPPPPPPLSSSSPLQPRYEQRFNERVYHPHSVMRDMSSQYQMYDSTSTAAYHHSSIPSTLLPEELHHAPYPPTTSDYSPQPSGSSGYYNPSLEEAIMYPPPQTQTYVQPYQPPSSYRDPNLYSYSDQTASTYQPQQSNSIGGYASPYPGEQGYALPIAMGLTDQDLHLHSHPPHSLELSLETPAPTHPNLTASSVTPIGEDEYPHYVVRY